MRKGQSDHWGVPSCVVVRTKIARSRGLGVIASSYSVVERLEMVKNGLSLLLGATQEPRAPQITFTW